MLPTIATGNVGSALAGEYEVANSLRFDDGSSDSLSRTPSSTTNQRTFTISFWIKSSTAGGTIFSTGDYSAGDGYFNVRLSSSGRLVLDDYAQGAGTYNNRWVTPSTTPFRDPSAWYHMVISIDSTQATLSDRVNFYVNGENIDSLFTDNASGTPSQNADFHINYNKVHQIGRDQNNSDYFDGYIAEFVLIDGQQLTPTSFGEFDEDTNIWKPIDVSGLTFGTNGFYLDFENSGSLGADVSGNGNNFTVNNLTSIDQSTDTCTNNFATWNPLRYTGNLVSFAEGNLKATALTDGSAFFHSAYSSIGVTQGKWYAEFKCAVGGNPTNNIMIAGGSYEYDQNGNNQNGIVSGITHYNGLGEFYVDTVSSTGLTTYTSGDIIGVALNVDDGQITFYKNGSQISTTRTLTTTASNGITYFIGIVRDLTVKSSWEANFGNPPFSISSGNSDANGYGNFEYSVPSGYYALNTKNLAEYG